MTTMLTRYNHEEIEKKWQAIWAESDLYTTNGASDKPKAYILDMFPYPSGEGLHVGHPKGYIATDVYSRFKKMSGFEVLHPMGWDAFGLPAENFAIKHKIHPRVAVEKNIANFKQQLAHLGFNYDWSREINTTDPEYYKWTQWIFLKLFENGLAYESHEPINWCPSCQTGLANEDLESDGTCERCGSVVEKRPMRQWVLKIRAYADRMLEDLDTLTKWPAHIKEAQRNWIGKSAGAKLTFTLSTGDTVEVFTTRPDTLFGATYMVLAPEHPLIAKLHTVITNSSEVAAYQKEAAAKDEITRTADGKEKTGIQLQGITATNPANGELIPVFIADYVLGGYGTGAIMAVPAHDTRDHAFAQKYDLPIRTVILPKRIDETNPHVEGKEIVFRKIIMGIVKNPATGKYLIMKWKNQPWTTFVIGGVEGDETAEEAARREIREESGYTNLKLVRVLGDAVHSEFYAGHKGENRIAHNTSVVFELIDETKEEVVPEEAAKHEPEWVEFSDITRDKMNHAELDIVLERLNTGNDMYTGKGVLINSGEFDGMSSDDAIQAITEKVGGALTSTYRLNDWVFSRQRYWGEPIPLIHCEKCGVVAVPYDQLPVRLPEVEHYEPTGTGESPLANITDWVNVSCPHCKGSAKRETNTMPQWAGSSWYYLRFIDPDNSNALIDPAKEKKWAPVDVYVGGDHAVRHLIYARFWHKFLYDIGVVSTIEPFERLEFLGFILAEDGRKMSKRWGNIINPDDIVKQNGADTLRVYEMFMGPFESTIAWNTNNLVGAQRFLERVNGLHTHVTDTEDPSVTKLLHQTIKKVREDIEVFKFNTAISALMILLNAVEKEGLTKATYTTFIKLLCPFAPHLAEELWHVSGATTSVHEESYPEYDEALAKEDTVTIGVQINGKMRGTITVAPDASEATALEAARVTGVGLKDGMEVIRVIYVPGKILNVIHRG